MGLSTTSLHFLGADPAGITPLLPVGALLRTQNAPWLTVLSPESDRGDPAILEKLAKQSTKADPTLNALLFVYHDDDYFLCFLYRGGRQAASCRSGESWAKLGKALDQLLPGCDAAKAFRYASHCVDLEEKRLLLEQTLGVALLDCTEFEPRTVPRSGQTLQAVKARESALKKRPNQCALTELAVEDWPLRWQAQYGLYCRIRPEWRKYDASGLLYDLGNPRYFVPFHPELAAYYVIFGERPEPAERLLLYSHRDGTMRELKIPGLSLSVPVWISGQGAPVCMASTYTVRTDAWGGRGIIQGQPMVVCLGPDSDIRWRFIPETDASLSYAHTAPDGTITFYSSGNSNVSQDAFLFRLNGESGELLCTRRIPDAENLQKLVRVEALDRFLYVQNWKELVLLDGALRETARWTAAKNVNPYVEQNCVVGSTLWDRDLNGTLRLYELRTGACREIKPEIPFSFLLAPLPDGRFLGLNEEMNRLTVFDPDGRVISRHGTGKNCRYAQALAEQDRICLLEPRFAETYGLTCDELFAGSTVHAWQLTELSS